ncbi:hypothetical protein [Mycolicibacterium stellerae]|uniref:hypothetical protein n=1 Tax=Mycolicibacterium stellerae TaxID=2358193 RepID=UPI000F0B6072|nr:hypothetical protein [Mycolicibacterium stellerae]
MSQDTSPIYPTQPNVPYDPLRLCIYASVALLAWLFGAWAVVAFAVLGVVGYVRARRAGLLRSQCVLRDTRLVIGYLGVIAAIGIASIVHDAA